MKNLAYILALALFLFSSVNAKESAKDLNKPVHQVINKYRNSPAVEMKLKKTVEMSLLGETKISSGSLYLSQGNMRYEISKPEKHLVVVSGKNIWIENRLAKEFGGKIQVTHLKSKKGQNKVKGFLAAFFGNSNIKEDLEFTYVSQGVYSIKFKRKESAPDITSSTMGLDKSKKYIDYIEYTDSLDNRTRHDFTKVKFRKSKKSSKFNYKRPKNSELTEM